jgi:hypothetical protein
MPEASDVTAQMDSSESTASREVSNAEEVVQRHIGALGRGEGG